MASTFSVPRRTIAELVVDVDVVVVHRFDIVVQVLAEEVEVVLASVVPAFAVLAFEVLAYAVVDHVDEKAFEVHFGGYRWQDLACMQNHS